MYKVFDKTKIVTEKRIKAAQPYAKPLKNSAQRNERLKIEVIIFEDSYIIITETLSSTMLMQNTCIIDYTPHKTRYQNFAYLI
jgi:phage terminase Nu1 subunit (DNA packaging protein)